jgi:hypothetical protein
MIGIKEAVAQATSIVRNLYSEYKLVDLLLEEIELSDDERVWLITMGFTPPGSKIPTVAGIQMGSRPRTYKRIRLDAETGAFKGMTDRELEEE